ncbi:MAG: hypothetical protein K0R31_107 [Clostridiales bacterium]|nr:hypothetical protein [Clostridiales bacterium]
MILKKRSAFLFCSVVLSSALMVSGCSKPVKAGGATDMLARQVEKVWSKYVPQPIQIVNKGAGGGVDGAVSVARSKPDGYTIEIGYGGGQDSAMPWLQKIEYDPFKDLVPVARLSVHSVAVCVPENSQFKSVKEIVDWAKKEKKPVTAAVSLAAGTVDLAMQGIGKYTGIQVTSIPHAGGAQSITTLIGGQTTMGGGHPAEIAPHLKSGKLKAIAIATPDRDPVLPDIPTLKEQGINFGMWGSIKGVAVPVGTPQEIMDYYADLFKKICDDPEFQSGMKNILEPVQYQNQKEFTAWFKSAFEDYGKLVKDLGLEKK